MVSSARSERETQDRVIRLFQNMGYAYLGDWSRREKNRAVEYELLEAFLRRQGVAPELMAAARIRIDKALPVIGHTLYEANAEVYELLRYGVIVSVGPGKPHETVRLVDWDTPENNDFALAEEVTLREGGDVRRPDIVLYLNGFAVGVIELKRASVTVGDGIRQLVSNQRTNPYFFVASQLLLAGNDVEGLYYGTCGTEEQFYVRWKEAAPVEPVPGCHLDGPLARLCNRETLLDLLRDGVLFDGGVKKVPRPHQYLALKAAQERLRRKEGGVIWHTQGSGKSLLMVMLVKWILEHRPAARVLIITDRTELDDQIHGVMSRSGATGLNAGESIVASRQAFRGKLQAPAPRLLCALIHKFDLGSDVPPEVHGELYVLVDECHRSQSGDFHEQMKRWLPNAIFIGFTGTPLLKADATSTRAVFGTYIHTYKFPEAVADGVVLDLKYEARTVPQELVSPQKVDAWFAARTTGLSDYQKALLRRRWGTMERLLSSRGRMQRIVEDICMDFDLKPRLAGGRGTAMLVADSIYDACRYFRLFEDTPLRGKCGVITSYNPSQADISREPEQGEEYCKYETYTRHVLSRELPDTERYEAEMKRRFKEEPARCRLLIVVSKLLVGFDAPSCSYIYLDKRLKDHTLFQAITRTNRLDGEDKAYGQVVDYKEQFASVQESVAVYSADELEPSPGAGADGDNILLKDRLREGRRELDAVRGELRVLYAHVPPPRELEDALIFFCGDAADPEALAGTAPLRDELYKLTARFLRIYGEMAQDLLCAGYSPAEAEAIAADIRLFGELRDAVRKFAGEELDLKPYERDMRHLIDMYIRADAPHEQGSLDDFSLLDLIVRSGIHEAIARKWLEKGTPRAVADSIVNNLRKAVNDKKETDPRFYENMSRLLGDLLEQQRSGALAYEAFLKRMEELAQQIAAGSAAAVTLPARLKGKKLAAMIYHNLPGLRAQTFICPEDAEARATLALDMEAALEKEAPGAWRGVPARENGVKALLYPFLQEDETATLALFELIKGGDFHV